MPLFAKSKSSSSASKKPSRPKSRQSWLRPLRWLGYLALGFFLSSTMAVFFFRFVPPPITPLMAIRGIGNVAHGVSPILDKDWEPMERISPRLAEAVVASEDQRFFEHHGFDWDAIVSAANANGRRKRKLGASTISQQTAKNLFLWPARSWTRKGLEAYFTFLLELMWSKERILEVYLNIIETGNGIYGAEAAAQRYFHVTAAALTASQAALIAASLPNPRKWSPAAPTGYLQRRQSWILRQMDQLGPMPNDLSQGGPRSVPGAPPAIRTRKSSLPVDDMGPQEDSTDESAPPAVHPDSGKAGSDLPGPSTSSSSGPVPASSFPTPAPEAPPSAPANDVPASGPPYPEALPSPGRAPQPASPIDSGPPSP